jgi:hypothetical protein
MAGLGAVKADTQTTFYGLADASAAVFLDERHFAVADDESAELSIFDVSIPERPASTLVLESLSVDRKRPEADIEGAARVGDRVYWIT